MPESGVAVAPGRVNLIGEHTDYNDGFVLPLAITRQVTVEYQAIPGRALRVHALGETAQIPLDRLAPRSLQGWPAYVAGVAWALADTLPLPPAELTITSDVPIGAGLSSSAALEIAVARALYALCDLPWDGRKAALLARQAENEFVGVNCGIMDQFACALAAPGTALLLDCRSLEYEHVAIPDEVVAAVIDTGARRRLDASEYNARVEDCRRAAQALGVGALRDATPDLVERAPLDALARKRARHVVQEMQRPHALAAAFLQRDYARAGALLRASHESLRTNYDVSSPELDAAVRDAEAHPACYGARLTGAGFGGCVVALVERAGMPDFAARLGRKYALLS